VALNHLYHILKDATIRQLHVDGVLKNRVGRFSTLHQCDVLTRKVSLQEAGIDVVAYMQLLQRIESSRLIED
jgi:hypothetical protein